MASKKRKLAEVLATSVDTETNTTTVDVIVETITAASSTPNSSSTVSTISTDDGAAVSQPTDDGRTEEPPKKKSRYVVLNAADILGPEEPTAHAAVRPSFQRPTPNQYYGDMAHNYMSRHGFQHGTGLGRDSSGIAVPIAAASGPLSQTGLGFASDVRPQTHEYSEEKVQIRVKPVPCPKLALESDPLTFAQLHTWFGVKKRVDKIGVEWLGTFCDVALQKEMLDAKSVFDEFGTSRFFRSARNKANPFEGIRSEFFQNRAALKICEMDKLTDFLFTQPPCCASFKSSRKERKREAMDSWQRGRVSTMSLLFDECVTREMLFFADICAGPGGFTEYFTHVCKWRARGWGFTMKGDNDFDFGKFNNNAPVYGFEAHYGPAKDGDITRNENIRGFRETVLKESNDGVHVVMADGGFNVSHDYNSQEILSKQLILCQFATAVAILRKGGVFVCKLFDTFHPFTASLLYILRALFDELSLVKPNQSRPANSERYVVCSGFLLSNTVTRTEHSVDFPTHGVLEHLLNVNKRMAEFKTHAIAVENQIKTIQQKHKSSAPSFVSPSKGGGVFGMVAASKCSTASTPPTATVPTAARSSDALPKEACDLLKTLKEVKPLVPVSAMDKAFVDWLKGFNETFIKRQTRFLKRIKKYCEDPTLRVDDQSRIREEAVKYWLTDASGRQRLKMDEHFSHSYVTFSYLRPMETLGKLLLSPDTVHGKELFSRFEFEQTRLLTDVDFESLDPMKSGFQRYSLRGDWWALAFPKGAVAEHRPEYVLLVQSTKGLYEVSLQDSSVFHATKVTLSKNDADLPYDSVVDCIKVWDRKEGRYMYRMFDAWAIGSQRMWDKPYIDRVQFCRMLFAAYGSDVLTFVAGSPPVQGLNLESWRQAQNDLVIFFIRARRTPDRGNPLSAYWRPNTIKIWVSGAVESPSFDELRETLESFERTQIERCIAKHKAKAKPLM